MAASTESLNYVQKMFIAFLGRAGAPAGMEYYAALIDADEESGKAILFDDLFYSDQGQELYGDATTIEIVKIIFNNVMNRDPEDAGLIYWVNAIDNGDFNVAEAAAIIADAAANDADDLAELEAKTTAADAITAHLTANPDDVAGYQAGFDEARSSLGDVDASNVDDFDAAAEVAGVINGIGYGGARTLSTGNDTVVGTDAQEVVTGIVGTGATFAAGDAISDATTGDSDTLNISGDDDYDHTAPTTGVSGFEIVNLDLAKQAASGRLAVTNVTNDVESLNIEVASTVEVVGITVDGETEVSVAGDLAGTVATTNVTDIQVTNSGTNAFAVEGDSSLAAITATGANDAGVTVTTDNDGATIAIGGADGANDAGSVSALGDVALTVNSGGNNIDELTLSGNGGAVTYTLTGADAGTEYTIEGDQDVTIVGDDTALSANPLTDNSTGTTTVNLSGGGATNFEQMGVVSGGIGITGDLTNSITLTVKAGNTVTNSATQNGALTFDGNDTTAGGELTLVMENDVNALTFSDYETVRINAGALSADADSITTGNNDTLAIAGTGAQFAVANDIVAGNVEVSISGAFSVDDITGNDAAADSSIVITADSIVANDVTTVSNDAVTLTSTGNDVTTNDIDAGTGAVTITSAGDASVASISAGAVSVEGGDLTVGAVTGTNVSLTSTNDAAASTLEGIDATGNVTITGGTWTQAAADDIDANDGTLTIDGADVTITGTNDVWAGSIVVTGANDVDLGDQVNTSVINASAATGAVVMTIDANDSSAGVTVQTGTGNDNIELDQLATIFNVTTGGGDDTVTITNANKTTIGTGDGDDTVNLTNANDTMTLNTGAGNDTVEVNSGSIDAASTIATGDGADTVNIDATSVGAALTVTTGAGGDTVQVDDTGNDVDVDTGAGADGITLAASTASVIDAGDDNDTVTLEGVSDATIDGGAGTDTLVMNTGSYADNDLSFSNIEKLDISAGNDVVLSDSQFAGDNTFELVGTGNLTNSFVTISATTANDTTIDASGVSTSVTTAASININGNDGDDTLTHNAYSGTINAGGGNDTIYGLAGADTIDGNDGNDTIDGGADADNITGGAGADTMTGGAGVDTFVFADGDNDVGIDVANDAMDTITDFVTGTDKIDVSGITSGSMAGNDANDVDGSGANDVAEVLELANDTLNASGVTEDIILVTDAMGSGDTYVYINVDNNGVLDDNDLLIILEDATPDTADFI